MDRTDLSAAIIADAGETVMALLQEALPRLLNADLAGIERQAQDVCSVPSCAGCGSRCRVGVEEAFADAANVVREAVGVWVSADSAERATERMGAVAEAAVQEAVGRFKQGQVAWSAALIEAPPTSGVLAVEVDGVQVHRDDGWHEMVRRIGACHIPFTGRRGWA